MLHSCGWLEGGLVASVEKFIMDADQLGVLNSLSQGIDVKEKDLAFEAIKDVGAGGHFLGCDHTQQNFKSAFWRSDILNYKPFETWADEGARDTQALASARVDALMDAYQQPALDPEIEKALRAYVAEKKASIPDSFI